MRLAGLGFIKRRANREPRCIHTMLGLDTQPQTFAACRWATLAIVRVGRFRGAAFGASGRRMEAHRIPCHGHERPRGWAYLPNSPYRSAGYFSTGLSHTSLGHQARPTVARADPGLGEDGGE